MSIADLTGMGIQELAADAGVSGIAGPRVSSEVAKGWQPPLVVVVALGIDYNPGGGARRLGLQAPTLAARCYGADRKQASQLGNAVAAAINMRGARRDGAGRLVHLSLVESGGDVILDPVTKWPYATVIFTLVGAQRAAP